MKLYNHILPAGAVDGSSNSKLGKSLVSVDESLESVPAEELLLPPAELLSPLTNL